MYRLLLYQMHDKIVWVVGMLWLQPGATQYMQLESLDKGRSIKGMIVYNDWDLEPIVVYSRLLRYESYKSRTLKKTTTHITKIGIQYFTYWSWLCVYQRMLIKGYFIVLLLLGYYYGFPIFLIEKTEIREKSILHKLF